MNRVSIDSDNGLSPILRQAIISTDAGLLSGGPLWTNFSEMSLNVNQNTNLLYHENAFETIVCEIVAILSRARWVESQVSICTLN